MKQVDLDLFEPFDGLIQIEVLGHTIEVPDNNCLLRSLQYVAGETIAYGRFCWNDECGNCEVSCVSAESGQTETIRACQARVYPGMRITSVSSDLHPGVRLKDSGRPRSVVFFDVGGTLLEVSPSVGHVYARACAELGHAVDPHHVQRAFDLAWITLSKDVPRGADRYRLFPGGETEWWERVSSLAFDECGVPAPARPPLAELRSVFAGAGAWRVFPETREALAELARRGHRLAVLSNWDSRLPVLLDTLGLKHHFEAIVHSAETGFEKPHPRIFDAALTAMGVDAADAVHIGDRYEEDFAGARAAGLRALLVSRDRAETPAGEHRVSDLNEAVRRIIA